MPKFVLKGLKPKRSWNNHLTLVESIISKASFFLGRIIFNKDGLNMNNKSCTFEIIINFVTWHQDRWNIYTFHFYKAKGIRFVLDRKKKVLMFREMRPSIFRSEVVQYLVKYIQSPKHIYYIGIFFSVCSSARFSKCKSFLVLYFFKYFHMCILINLFWSTFV